MEKTNLSKRVVAGTLALLTVFGSAPASLQGVFAPSTLSASAEAATEFAVTFGAVKDYIVSITDGVDTYTATQISKLDMSQVTVAKDATITIVSSVKLNADGLGTPTVSDYKYTYSYKVTKAARLATAEAKAITTEAAEGSGIDVTQIYYDYTVDPTGAKTADTERTTVIPGAKVTASSTYPFTVKDSAATPAEVAKGTYDVEKRVYVATFAMPDTDAKLTVRQPSTDYTYTNKGNSLIVNNDDIVNGKAAEIGAVYVETITVADYNKLSAADKALYNKPLDYAKDTDTVTKKTPTAITSGDTVEYGKNARLYIFGDQNFLGKSAPADVTVNKTDYKVNYIFQGTIKYPGKGVLNIFCALPVGFTGTPKAKDYVTSATNAQGNEVSISDILVSREGGYILKADAAGDYEVNLNVWTNDATAAAEKLSYKFTVGTSDGISEANIKLGDGTTEKTCEKGKVTSFNTKKAGDAYTPVHVTPTLIGTTLKEGDYYFTGSDTATTPGTENTITLNVISADYGASAENPLKVDVKWTLVDPTIADNISWKSTEPKTINYYNVAADKTKTAKTADALKGEILDEINVAGTNVKKEDITFSFEAVDANGEEDLDRDVTSGDGIPAGTGYWKITAKWDKIEIARIFNFKDNDTETTNVLARPANADETTVTYGDKLNITDWEFYINDANKTEVDVDFLADTNVKAQLGTLKKGSTTEYEYGEETALKDLDLGDVGTKKIKLVAQANRATGATTPGTNELNNSIYTLVESEFTVDVVARDFSTADIADIIVAKGANAVVKVRDTLEKLNEATSDDPSDYLYMTTDKNVTTGEKFGVTVLSGVTIVSETGEYEIVIKSNSENYTGSKTVKWKVVESEAGFTLDLAHTTVETEDKLTAELSGLNKVKATVKRSENATTSSTELGVLYGTADDKAAAKEALVYEGAGKTCKIQAGTGIAKTATGEDAKKTLEVTVADPAKTWVRAYAVDEGGTIVYSDPYQVDINTLYKAAVGENLKADAPVYIDDNGTIKAYVYAERPKIEVGETGKKTEITPESWGVVVSRDGKYTEGSENFVLGAADTVTGTFKAANDVYTDYNYGVKIKLTNLDADILVKPYVKFADGSVVYGTVQKLENLNDAVVKETKLFASTVVDTKNHAKAKMRVTRQVTGALLYEEPVIANDNIKADAAKKTYTRVTQPAVAAVGTTPAKAAVTTQAFKLVDLSSADAFGVVVDKSGALKYKADAATDADKKVNAATEAALVVGSTYTVGISKTPNVASISEAGICTKTGEGVYGEKEYKNGILTEGYAAYGAATTPTSTDKAFTFRGYVTYGNYTFYTAPVCDTASDVDKAYSEYVTIHQQGSLGS